MMKIFKFFEKAGYVRAINRLERQGLYKQANTLRNEMPISLLRENHNASRVCPTFSEI